MPDANKSVDMAHGGNIADAVPLYLTKRIGSTTFVVAVHFSRTSKDKAEDILYRLIEREVENAA